MQENRRQFFALTGAVALAPVALLGEQVQAQSSAESDAVQEQPHKEVGISAPEDLMREHGVLNRILLIYEQGVKNLRLGTDVSPEIFEKPARLVRKFVEDYHEKLEEEFIFPRFEKQQKLVELTAVLRQQHQAGRQLTDQILSLSNPKFYVKGESREEIARACDLFIRMYRPHEAREDTVLFPSLYEIASAKEIKELGEQFEEREHRLFGEEGFQKTVEEVAAIEKQLGIYELASFTPR
jgi:hemerythrin-like domain-containing protein